MPENAKIFHARTAIDDSSKLLACKVRKAGPLGAFSIYRILVLNEKSKTLLDEVKSRIYVTEMSTA